MCLLRVSRFGSDKPAVRGWKFAKYNKGRGRLTSYFWDAAIDNKNRTGAFHKGWTEHEGNESYPLGYHILAEPLKNLQQSDLDWEDFEKRARLSGEQIVLLPVIARRIICWGPDNTCLTFHSGSTQQCVVAKTMNLDFFRLPRLVDPVTQTFVLDKGLLAFWKTRGGDRI